MSDLFPVPDSLAQSAWADSAKYEEMYKRSIEDPEGFWAEEGKRIDWIRVTSAIKSAPKHADQEKEKKGKKKRKKKKKT